MKYAKFAESAPITSNLGVNPENSRKYSEGHKFCANRTTHQQITQNSQDLHTTDKISYTFFTHFAHILLHVFLHVCTHHAPL